MPKSHMFLQIAIMRESLLAKFAFVLLRSNVDSFMWTLVWWWKILNNFFLNYCFLNILFLTSPDGALDPWSCFHLGVEQKNYLLKSVSRRKDRPLGKRCPSKYVLWEAACAVHSSHELTDRKERTVPDTQWFWLVNGNTVLFYWTIDNWFLANQRRPADLNYFIGRETISSWPIREDLQIWIISLANNILIIKTFKLFHWSTIFSTIKT